MNLTDICQPAAGYLTETLQSMQQFTSRFDPETKFHLTPPTKTGARAMYVIQEYEPLLDSSCMGPANWNQMVRSIRDAYCHFDAFVVLHVWVFRHFSHVLSLQGTDTMAYSASALSFQLENLSKIVILTGSQIPLSETRNDAYDNLLGSLFIATEYASIPEVCLFFDQTLYRGNRASKVSATGLDAFASPNLPPLVQLSVDVDVDWRSILRTPQDGHGAFRAFEVMDDAGSMVVVVFFYPGMSAESLERMLCNGKTKAAVLLTFGAGNLNVEDDRLLAVLARAHADGVIMINVTQCRKGKVIGGIYAAGSLSHLGIVPGIDMTVEAAFCKLVCVSLSFCETSHPRVRRCISSRRRKSPHRNGRG